MNMQQASIRTAAAKIAQNSPVETAALDRVLLHHARTCTYWIFSGLRACSCGVIAARLELQQIRETMSAQAGETLAKVNR